MSNPERPRAQAVKPAQEKVPDTADLTHADWGRLDEVWNQPTVVDGKAQVPTTPSDTHDDTAMLDRARGAVQDPRRAEQVAARVYAGQEAAGRAAQVGDRVDLINDLPDPIQPIPDDVDTGPVSLEGESEDEELFRPSFYTDDPATADTPFSLERNLPTDKPFWDASAMGNFAEDVAGSDEVSHPPQAPIVERTSSRKQQADAAPASLEPIVPGSISDIRNLTRTPRTAAPRTETITVVPEPPATSWFGKKAQAALDTLTRWGRRLGLVAALAVPTNQTPQEATSTYVVEKPQAAPAPDRPTIVVPRVEVATPTVPTTPVQQPRSSERVPSQRVVAPPPDNLPVAVRYRNDSKQPAQQTVVATEEDVRPMQIEPAMPPVPVAPASVDVEAPKTVTPVAEAPVAPADVAKQLNAEMSKSTLSPEKQIDYVKSLFESLDSSKVFIRLSPTKRLELRQSASGDIVARFPGEKDFRSLTPEDVSTLGKDLSRQPHYTR